MQTVEPLTRDRVRALSELPVIGRNRDFSRLLTFAKAKTPALVCGPPGIGKTRMLLELRQKLMAEGYPVLYVRFRQPLHNFLLTLAHELSIESPHGSSTALRGTVWNTFEVHPHILLLDDICAATPPFYRLLERILTANGNAIIGAALHEHATGTFQRIFWNQEYIVKLHSLNRTDTATLIQSCIARFLSDPTFSPEFAERIAHAARGNPGRVLEMCIRAADPAYRGEGNRIRFGALLMDSLTRLLP